MEAGINPGDYGVTPFTTGRLTMEDVDLIVKHATREAEQ